MRRPCRATTSRPASCHRHPRRRARPRPARRHKPQHSMSLWSRRPERLRPSTASRRHRPRHRPVPRRRWTPWPAARCATCSTTVAAAARAPARSPTLARRLLPLVPLLLLFLPRRRRPWSCSTCRSPRSPSRSPHRSSSNSRRSTCARFRRLRPAVASCPLVRSRARTSQLKKKERHKCASHLVFFFLIFFFFSFLIFFFF